LVDVIPHSLGIAAVSATAQSWRAGMFSTIIPRNEIELTLTRLEKLLAAISQLEE